MNYGKTTEEHRKHIYENNDLNKHITIIIHVFMTAAKFIKSFLFIVLL
jgi:hypothetical protein